MLLLRLQHILCVYVLYKFVIKIEYENIRFSGTSVYIVFLLRRKEWCLFVWMGDRGLTMLMDDWT
jgi:hypothetical protein